tara:strand:+ start:10416 stop:11468 length:1053 start_codon:yes stop_codon:yes gene_type:complete
MENKTFLITGGYGFIGSALIRQLLKLENVKIINIDNLTYASNLRALGKPSKDQYKHYKTDICDFLSLKNILNEINPNFVIHLAAETHVDRSIDGPDKFISTNIQGTYNLLKCSYNFWSNLAGDKKKKFKFIHISTDEVYGSLKKGQKQFTENNPYEPNSPYSASKASSDHLVKSWNKTYNFPSIITNTCNNYGPWQFPEKLIPLTIKKCLSQESIPLFGSGLQIRDWIHVEDHVSGILKVLEKGVLGEKYNIGSDNEIQNIDVVSSICNILNKKLPSNLDYNSLIVKVTDRPGHDFRYGINNSKILQLGWTPKYTWSSGLESTIDWYLSNKVFFDDSMKNNYSGERLGKI